eukprot:NODE_3511_length_765_cov_149.009777_g2938_i0.p1 GENE.NODE_3511_length_765_cov_149.009777_g2938_i0~~NODE_3511_length_765_cov_149.009777_g2938_i0.p1  ORF type:complete len:116 (+),score=24.42 NODE_3511_length_765_cov_149.009777_g2938_i0:323-670(+)
METHPWLTNFLIYHSVAWLGAVVVLVLCYTVKSYDTVNLVERIIQTLVFVFLTYANINLFVQFYQDGKFSCISDKTEYSYGMVYAHVVFGWIFLVAAVIGLIVGSIVFYLVRKAA